jgi:hypothetical protein
MVDDQSGSGETLTGPIEIAKQNPGPAPAGSATAARKILPARIDFSLKKFKK